MILLLKPMFFLQSLILFEVDISNFEFLFSKGNAVWENQLRTISYGAGSE